MTGHDLAMGVAAAMVPLVLIAVAVLFGVGAGVGAFIMWVLP